MNEHSYVHQNRCVCVQSKLGKAPMHAKEDITCRYKQLKSKKRVM